MTIPVLLRHGATAVAAGRVVLGLTALAWPAGPARPWVGTAADGLAAQVFGRALGARDLALGLGALAALRRPGAGAAGWGAGGAGSAGTGAAGAGSAAGVGSAGTGAAAAGAAAWVAAGALSDALDVAASLASWRELPRAGRWLVVASAGGAALAGAAGAMAVAGVGGTR